jgi:hypothetical protein
MIKLETDYQVDIYNNSSIFFWYKPDLNSNDRYPSTLLDPSKASFIPSCDVNDLFILTIQDLKVEIDQQFKKEAKPIAIDTLQYEDCGPFILNIPPV